MALDVAEKAHATIGQSVHATILSQARWYIIVAPPAIKSDTKANLYFGQIDPMKDPRDRRVAASLLRQAAEFLEGLGTQ